MKILVIGFGIAGMTVSFALLKEHHQVTVVDDEMPGSASRIAAGIVNPVVFKRLTTSWRVKEFIVSAEQFYTDWENLLGFSFYHKKNILKILSSAGEQRMWLNKQNDPELIDFISLLPMNKAWQEKTNTGESSGLVNHSAWLNLHLLQEKWRIFLQNQNSYQALTINYTELKPERDHITWQNEKYDCVIFCEGIKAAHNPFLPVIPFQFCKGETLLIESADLPDDYILNKEIYVLPLGEKRFKTGSTYQWDFTDPFPSEEGKKELSLKLNGLLRTDYRILQHEAAIRPTVRERRPWCGFVSEQKLTEQFSTIGMLNGLGTKGVMMAPFFATRLAQYMKR